jgi:hypothetical protein
MVGKPPAQSLSCRLEERSKNVAKSARNLGVLAFLLAAAGSLAAADDAKPLKAGDDLPGAFQVLMVTGPRPGMFHCPVCEYDLYPSVLVFVGDAEEPGKPVLELLKKLDAAIARHAGSHVGGCAIFLNDGGYRKALETPVNAAAKAPDQELAKATVLKDQRVAALESLAKKQDLKHLTLALSSAEGPAGCALDKNAGVTVLVSARQKIVGAYAFPKGHLTDQEVDKILKQVDEMAAASVIPARRKN